MHLDPVSLRLFIHVAETGTLVESAKRLNIVPSAASKRIAILEDQLKTQLLRRTNHGAELTAAGQALEGMARRVLAELDSISVQIRDYSIGLRGRVRVLANASAICQFLPGELAAFMLEHPQIDVHFEECDSEGILKRLDENMADIGITFTLQHGYAMEEVPYHRYDLAVLVPSAHVLASQRSVRFQDTLEHPHVGLWASSAANLYMNRRAADLGRLVNYRMHVDSYHSMALMVEAGLGIAIAPKGLMKPFNRSFGVKVLRLEESWASRELRIFFPSYDRLQATGRLLVEYFEKQVRGR